MRVSAPECRLSGTPCLCDRLRAAVCPQCRLAQPSGQPDGQSAQVVPWKRPPPTKDAAITSSKETAAPSAIHSEEWPECRETERCPLPHGPWSPSQLFFYPQDQSPETSYIAPIFFKTLAWVHPGVSSAPYSWELLQMSLS